MGRRRRVEIKKIEEVEARNVTFSKRRKGLFKKAEGFAKDFDARVAVLVLSPAGNPFVCGDLRLFNDAVGCAHWEAEPVLEAAAEGSGGDNGDDLVMVETEAVAEGSTCVGDDVFFLENDDLVVSCDDLWASPPVNEVAASAIDGGQLFDDLFNYLSPPPPPPPVIDCEKLLDGGTTVEDDSWMVPLMSDEDWFDSIIISDDDFGPLMFSPI